jgi:hypothetical protein
MANAPTLGPGVWVQLNSTTESPRAGKPSAEEQTIGKVMQAFSSEGDQYYQVIWNPGDMNPKTGLYKANELTSLDQQTADQIRQQIAAGTYQPNIQKQGSNYQEPTL